MNRIHKMIRRFEALSEESPRKTFVFRYVLATIFVFIAFFARLALDHILKTDLPFTFFITSSLLAAFFGRIGAGMYSLVLGWFLADYFFVPPYGSIGRYGKLEFISFITNLGPAFFSILLIEFFHIARRQARMEIEARTKAEAELSEAKRQLEQVNLELEERVTERTKELEQSVRFLEGFCYSIAHDLRAPLRAMQGFVLALHEDYAEQLDEKGKEYGQRILVASKRMDKLVLDLLDYGRLNQSRIQIENQSVEAAIEHVTSRLDKVIQTIKADVDIRHPLHEVRADALLLDLILYHLLDNALKFGRPKIQLKIAVWATESRDSVRIFIRDNGVGIEAQYQQRIFRLFETIHPVSATATGAGLALVSKAVERMNGRVGVESEPDNGSTFWIELPKARHDQPWRGKKNSLKEEHPVTAGGESYD